VVRQRWLRMTFLHWAYDPAVVQRLLPDGLEVDAYDGAAWVSLTPFMMRDFRPPLLPAVPGVSHFPETNLRTYVRGPGGGDGLWFLSLEADSLTTVVGARAGYWVRYHWASMAVEGHSPVRYTSRRRPPGDPSVGHRITVSPGDPFGPEELDGLDHFLTGRWGGYTQLAGRLCWAPVEHEPWPLWRARVDELDQALTGAAGLPAPEEEPLVHFSPGVRGVRLGAPWPASGPAARART
jgi:uncharacterized protein YqjF (DUF2071 family)